MLVTLTDHQGAITLTVSKEIAERIKNDSTHCPATSICPPPVTAIIQYPLSSAPLK
ncbi:hypothetical protein G5714_004330 [Onychostoma macrolepis]|uniref:Uncharacterized protein n=1 Tax=Onychostoma macrolepis TaxID=369639 RepID=A0A7J6D4G6_9TELE|nr:hypothetical protein G5714_004330 [Onychostoma macrolepis]